MPNDQQMAIIPGESTFGDTWFRWYKYDVNSSATHDGEDVIKPTSVVGNGRWLKQLNFQTPVDWNATSGYLEILNKPTLLSQFTNDSGFITGINSSAVTTALGYTPINPNGNSSQYFRGDGTLATFPSIPAAQVNSDWNSVSGLSQILNKPVIENNPTGVILNYGGTSAPSGYFLCDGSAVSRTTYSALFAVIGTTFGSGDGSTTFNIPDTRQRFVLNKANAGTGSALGATGGAIDHVHTVDPPNTTTGAPSGNVAATILAGSAASPTHTHDVNIAQFDSGSNNPPYIVFNSIIKY